MSRLTPILGAYYGTQSIGTGYYEQAESGGQSEGTEIVNGIGWQYVQASSAGSAFNERAVGELPFQNFVDPLVDDAGMQLRYRDLVQVQVIGGGGLAYAAVGFYSVPGSTYDPREYTGFFWAMLEDGLWHAMLTSYTRSNPPTRILRNTVTVLDATDEIFLGLIADGEKKTLYWLANNQVVDFYKPIEWIEGGSAQPKWRARVSVINDNAKFRFHGGGDAYIVSIGEAEEADISQETVDTPTITVVDYGTNWARFSGSTFNHSGTASHLASQWQVALDADVDFTSPVHDSDWQCQQKTSYNTGGVLVAETDYRARVRYIADDGVRSDWSDAATFTTLAADESIVTPWSNDGAICQDGETIPETNWDNPSC